MMCYLYISSYCTCDTSVLVYELVLYIAITIPLRLLASPPIPQAAFRAIDLQEQHPT